MLKNHQYYMAQAIQLARLGLDTTTPNPRVGCLLVKDEKIIGQGFHLKAGAGHAEVNAIADCQQQFAAQSTDLLAGATAYVTLEPCSHFGRTPPCAQALIDHGITDVVIAMGDPNPQVAGNGIKMLESAGIKVELGCLENDAKALNPGFIKRMQTAMPFVRIKSAISLDGRTAMQSGESQWITGPAARADVQRLRAQSCAIITGADSVLIDDPAMTVRLEQLGEKTARQPVRVIIDSQHRVDGQAKIFQQDGDIIIVCLALPELKIERDAKLGRLDYLTVPANNGKVSIKQLLKLLAEQGLQEILVESGAQLAGAFIRQQLVDQMIIYTAPTLLGSQARGLFQLPFEQMSEQLRWAWQDVRMVGNDLRLTLTPEPN